MHPSVAAVAKHHEIPQWFVTPVVVSEVMNLKAFSGSAPLATVTGLSEFPLTDAAPFRGLKVQLVWHRPKVGSPSTGPSKQERRDGLQQKGHQYQLQKPVRVRVYPVQDVQGGRISESIRQGNAPTFPF
jgi:hypothetical protein